MKVEYLYQNRAKRTLGDRAVAAFDTAVNFQWAHGLLNPLLNMGVTKKLMGIAEERSMPKLASGRWMRYYKKYYTVKRAEQAPAAERVVLWVDEFTASQEPELAGKALDILEHLGYTCALVYAPSGRAKISGGFLPEAKKVAAQSTQKLRDTLEVLGNSTPIIGLEPSAVLSAKDEYLRLLEGDSLAWLKEHSNLLQTFDKFLAAHVQSGKKNDIFEPYKGEILLHVHCHQKSLESAGDTAFALQGLLGAKVERIKSSCCGMAGSYGLKKENQEMSRKMANLVLIPSIEEFKGEYLVATGTSCRHQIKDLAGENAAHLADLLWPMLKR